MSLFGSLFTGVSGLSAQSQATAMISNNIANVNTVGFKRSEAAFFSLVTTESRGARYSPGTVSVSRIQHVNQQGPTQQSASGTDVSVSGNGFFAVRRDPGFGDSEYLYTRNGQFSEDAEGYLRNSAGFYLYGWPLDANGNLPAAQGDLSSLQAVDVAFLGGLTRPTTTSQIAITLNASERPQELDPATNLVPPGTAAHFTRSQTVYDSLGAAQTITYEFTKVFGPQALDISVEFDMELADLLVADVGLTAGHEFDFQVGANAAETFTITPTSTVNDLMAFINNYNGGNTAEAYLNDDGELVIQSVLLTDSWTLTDDAPGTAVADLGFSSGVAVNPGAALPPGNTDGTFPNLNNEPGDPLYNGRGWWQVNVRSPNGTYLAQGLMNFNGNGSINAVRDSNGNIDIELDDIDWGNGSNLQNISVDISRFTQFAGNYNVISADQNGAELGLRTGVEIDRQGFVVAQFSNGATARLYKLPMVTFSNPNGLQEVSGTAYSKTEESGEENLREAGRGGAGFLETSTVEISNVDLADEFSKLIISQRAYSANTKIINTVDQMTEELLRLR